MSWSMTAALSQLACLLGVVRGKSWRRGREQWEELQRSSSLGLTLVVVFMEGILPGNRTNCGL